MTKPFKVIIIGGGPVGLTAAHAFHKAGIDFVVLEQREQVVADSGASLVLAPHNLRVMRQLGILDRLLEIGAQLRFTRGFLLNGYQYKNLEDLETLSKNHGYGMVAFHRAHLVQTLYDTLPEEVKSRFLNSKKVTGIEEEPHGVKVTCTDGSSYEGDIVLGADGTHSKTRNIIREAALQSDPKAEWDPESPYVSEFRCMWCSFPRPDSSDPGENFETTNKDFSAMYLTGRERGWILLYDRLPKPSTERHFYTDEDVEAFAGRLAEYPVTETLKVKDVFAKRLTFGMSDLQEGIVDHWSRGRVVLAGDACHKFTPNAGLGLNNGIQDVVVLSNELQLAITETEGGHPDTEALAKAFERYQTTRLPPLKEDYDQSAMATRLQTWANGLYYFLERFVLSYNFITNAVVNYILSPRIRSGLILNGIGGAGFPKGRIEWQHKFLNSSENIKA